jgi:hypothetical protein
LQLLPRFPSLARCCRVVFSTEEDGRRRKPRGVWRVTIMCRFILRTGDAIGRTMSEVFFHWFSWVRSESSQKLGPLVNCERDRPTYCPYCINQINKKISITIDSCIVFIYNIAGFSSTYKYSFSPLPPPTLQHQQTRTFLSTYHYLSFNSPSLLQD